MSDVVVMDRADVGPVELQQYQEIYQELTRKFEVSVTFERKRHIISIDHISELHRVIQQTSQTMGIVQCSCYVTQRFNNDTQERWSAIEKLREFGTKIPQVTADVEIVYHFLIKLPHTRNPGAYKIKINLRNQLKDLQKYREQRSELDNINYLMLAEIYTAKWEVEFADMSVARTFTNAISAWYHSIPEYPITPTEKFIVWVKPYLNVSIRLICASLLAWTLFGSSLLKKEPLSPHVPYLFVFLLYCIHFLAIPFIEILQRRMSCIRSAASLKLTRPDGELIEQEEKARGRIAKWIWINAFMPLLPTVVIIGGNFILSLL